MKDVYVFEYLNENEFHKLERSLKKYNMLAYKKLYFDKKAPAFHVWDKRNTVSDIHGKGQLAPLHSKLAFMPLPFPGFGIPGEAHANTIF